MDDLTNAELAILGLIVEMPRHGYEIERCIVERGMRDWTEIGFSSIYYILNKLEGAGWLHSQMYNSGNKPLRKVYTVSESGLEIIRQAVRQRLIEPRPHSADFDLALAYLAVLDVREYRTILEERRQGLLSVYNNVQKKWEHDGGDRLPLHVGALFSHSLAIIQAELAWLDGFMADLNKKENVRMEE